MPPFTKGTVNIPPETLRILDEIGSQFELDNGKLHEILNNFVEKFDYGLAHYGHPMAMIPTFVRGVPTGQEVGYVRWL